MLEPLLSIEELTLRYRQHRRATQVLRGVSMRVSTGETVGVVGESGSGKSQTALAALRLLGPGAEITGGRIIFGGDDLTRADEESLRRLRGRDLAMVFQDPMSSLDPVMRVGEQIAEALTAHPERTPRNAVSERVLELIRQVGLPDPERLRQRYPHQLSGGQRQRIGIAMAMANEPRLLIADEPTTALDVTVQAQVLDLLSELQGTTGMAMVLITHDLALVAQYAQRVLVMYAGEVVEEGPTGDVFTHPKHPYTRGLLDSRPRLAGPGRRTEPLPTIRGVPMDASRAGTGCAFLPRCRRSADRELCAQQTPPVDESGEQLVRCHLPLTPGPPHDGERDE